MGTASLSNNKKIMYTSKTPDLLCNGGIEAGPYYVGVLALCSTAILKQESAKDAQTSKV